MLNKISTTKIGNIYFKAGDNKINPQYEAYKKETEIANDTFVKSTAIGATFGFVHYALKKNANKAFKFGSGAYLFSTIALTLMNAVRIKKEAQEKYKKYEKNTTPKNDMERFIESLSTPTYVDLGSEVKNEKYYKMSKEMNIDANKVSIISLGIGAIVGIASGVMMLIKNVPDKLSKTFTAAMLATTISVFTGNIALISKRTEIYNKQGEK